MKYYQRLRCRNFWNGTASRTISGEADCHFMGYIVEGVSINADIGFFTHQVPWVVMLPGDLRYRDFDGGREITPAE